MTLHPDVELAPTPDLDGHGPLRATPDWWRTLREGADAEAAHQLWLANPRCPVEGARRSISGVDLVEVTFLAWKPEAEQVLVHLSGLTDAHRTDLRPSLMERVGGTGLWGATFLLGADAILGYRITDVTGLAHDVGSARPGWKEVHRRGLPDEHNPDTIPTPLGGDSSVWRGPDAPVGDWPTGELAGWHELDEDGTELSVLPGDERVVVCFDRDHWSGNRLGAGLRGAGLGHTLVLVANGAGQRREDLLTQPEPAAGLVRQALRAAGTVLGQECPQAHALAGQSYGGLAVAWLLATHPELTRSGIVQSGSFWFNKDTDPRPPVERPDLHLPGTLLSRLQDGSLPIPTGEAPPVVIQVGSDEPELQPLARDYREALRARGALHVQHREFRGGHDHAWWRHGLIDGLRRIDEVLGTAR